MKKVVISIISIIAIIAIIAGIKISMSNQDNEIENETENNAEVLNEVEETNDEQDEEEATVNADVKVEEDKDKEENVNKNKVLIAYFSRSGNTEAVANLIKENMDADIFKIQTVKSYPEDYTETTNVAQQEQNDNARPELSNHVDNMDEYDVVFVGYPIWWGTMPMALFTFLEEYNFDDKIVVPFCTHGGSGLSRSENDIKELLGEAEVLSGLAISGSNIASSETKTSVDSWIAGLNIK